MKRFYHRHMIATIFSNYNTVESSAVNIIRCNGTNFELEILRVWDNSNAFFIILKIIKKNATSHTWVAKGQPTLTS